MPEKNTGEITLEGYSGLYHLVQTLLHLQELRSNFSAFPRILEKIISCL